MQGTLLFFKSMTSRKRVNYNPMFPQGNLNQLPSPSCHFVPRVPAIRICTTHGPTTAFLVLEVHPQKALLQGLEKIKRASACRRLFSSQLRMVAMQYLQTYPPGQAENGPPGGYAIVANGFSRKLTMVHLVGNYQAWSSSNLGDIQDTQCARALHGPLVPSQLTRLASPDPGMRLLVGRQRLLFLQEPLQGSAGRGPGRIRCRVIVTQMVLWSSRAAQLRRKTPIR